MGGKGWYVDKRRAWRGTIVGGWVVMGVVLLMRMYPQLSGLRCSPELLSKDFCTLLLSSYSQRVTYRSPGQFFCCCYSRNYKQHLSTYIWSQKTVSMKKPVFFIHFYNFDIHNDFFNVCWKQRLMISWTSIFFNEPQHLICWPCFFWNTELHWRHVGVFQPYLELFWGYLIATSSWRKGFFFCPCLRCCGVV